MSLAVISGLRAAALGITVYYSMFNVERSMFVPLPLQQRFAAIVEKVEAQKTRMRSQLTELDTLFDALQQRASNGEL